MADQIIFTYKQIENPAFFAEHEAEIALAMAEGRIVEDLPVKSGEIIETKVEVSGPMNITPVETVAPLEPQKPHFNPGLIVAPSNMPIPSGFVKAENLPSPENMPEIPNDDDEVITQTQKPSEVTPVAIIAPVQTEQAIVNVQPVSDEMQTPEAKEVRARFEKLGLLLTYNAGLGWSIGNGVDYDWVNLIKKLDRLESGEFAKDAREGKVEEKPAMSHPLAPDLTCKTLYFFKCNKCGKGYRRTMDFGKAIAGVCDNCLRKSKTLEGQTTLSDIPRE